MRDSLSGRPALDTTYSSGRSVLAVRTMNVLPESESEVEVSQKNILHLLIQPDGTVQVKRGENPQIQTATANQIGSIWRQEFSANPNLIAAVKTHPNASYRSMIDVLDQLQAAQADKISLQILEE